MPRKPGIWAVNRGAIDPRHRGLWRNLIFCLPFWGPGGVSQDIAGGHTVTQVGAAPDYTGWNSSGLHDPDGKTAVYDNPGAGNYWTTDFAPDFGTGDFTVIARLNLPAPGIDGYTFIGARADTSGQDETFRIFVDATGADSLDVWVSDTAGVSLNTELAQLSVLDDTASAELVAVRRRTGTVTQWLNGVQIASGTVAGDMNFTQAGHWWIWAANLRGSLWADTDDAKGGLSLLAVWDRALSDAELQTLQSDPWSFLRPVPAKYRQAVTGDQTITGALFTKAPAFPTGSVDLRLNGVAFTRARSFGTGQINLQLVGALHTQAPSFAAGSINFTLTGALSAQAPTFATGAVQPQSVTVIGVLHTQAPTFGTGQVTLSILGALFAKAPTFPGGDVTTGETITGVLFALAPTFAVGAVQPQQFTITGTLFTQSPAFGVGAVSVVGVFFWEPDPVSYTALEPAEVNPAP